MLLLGGEAAGMSRRQVLVRERKFGDVREHALPPLDFEVIRVENRIHRNGYWGLLLRQVPVCVAEAMLSAKGLRASQPCGSFCRRSSGRQG